MYFFVSLKVRYNILYIQNDYYHPHQSLTHQYGIQHLFWVFYLLLFAHSHHQLQTYYITETFWLSSSISSVSLEILCHQNVHHCLYFCSDTSSLDEFFQCIWIANFKHLSSLFLMSIHAFFNDIHFGKSVYLPALVGLYLFYIICIPFTLTTINPDW